MAEIKSNGADSHRPFRVLSLDGGGMRGTYTATYLSRLERTFATRRGVAALDLGRAFDLVVGTSTGAIVGCALAAGVPLQTVVDFYRQRGPSVFPRRLPRNVLGVIVDWIRRSKALAGGNEALRVALKEMFGTTTLSALYTDRKIGLAITAVELSQHRSWIFKTPHSPGTNHRDDGYELVDVCLASTAAPVYRSLAAVGHADDGPAGYRVFVDGGLWANNPVLVGLVEALSLAAPARPIQIFCLGTCPRPAGEQIAADEVHRNLNDWKFGGAAAALSIDAQEFAFDHVARLLAPHFKRECAIVRFPREQVPAALMPFLDLDDTSTQAMDALINQARSDADMTNSRCGSTDDRDGQLICQLFTDAPERTDTRTPAPCSHSPGTRPSTSGE